MLAKSGPLPSRGSWSYEVKGLVAKRMHEPYLCSERSWVKVKNRSYWRYELEREGAIRSRQRKSGTLA
jgi:ATP-dependent DNA ligase